jgi:hypothetical protein
MQKGGAGREDELLPENRRNQNRRRMTRDFPQGCGEDLRTGVTMTRHVVIHVDQLQKGWPKQIDVQARKIGVLCVEADYPIGKI